MKFSYCNLTKIELLKEAKIIEVEDLNDFMWEDGAIIKDRSLKSSGWWRYEYANNVFSDAVIVPGEFTEEHGYSVYKVNGNPSWVAVDVYHELEDSQNNVMNRYDKGVRLYVKKGTDPCQCLNNWNVRLLLIEAARSRKINDSNNMVIYSEQELDDYVNWVQKYVPDFKMFDCDNHRNIANHKENLYPMTAITAVFVDGKVEIELSSSSLKHDLMLGSGSISAYHDA